MIGALLMILNLPEASGRALPDPGNSDNSYGKRRLKNSLKDRALAFMKRTMDEVEDRHFAAHAIWDNFVPTASEPTIRVRRIKLRGKTSIIDVIDSEISITLIQRALAEINRLNGQLLEFTLQPPPSNICVL